MKTDMFTKKEMISFRLPREIIVELNSLSRENGTDRTNIVIHCLNDGIQTQKRRNGVKDVQFGLFMIIICFTLLLL